MLCNVYFTFCSLATASRSFVLWTTCVCCHGNVPTGYHSYLFLVFQFLFQNGHSSLKLIDRFIEFVFIQIKRRVVLPEKSQLLSRSGELLNHTHLNHTHLLHPPLRFLSVSLLVLLLLLLICISCQSAPINSNRDHYVIFKCYKQ